MRSHECERRSDGAEKVPAHRSQEKANAFSASTNDRERWDEHFVSPKKRPATAIWDFFSTVRSACATHDKLLDAKRGEHRVRFSLPRGPLLFQDRSRSEFLSRCQ